MSTDGTLEISFSLTSDEALALAQLCNRFTYSDAVRLAHAYDGGRERDAMLDAISTTGQALAKAGYAPR